MPFTNAESARCLIRALVLLCLFVEPNLGLDSGQSLGCWVLARMVGTAHPTKEAEIWQNHA